MADIIDLLLASKEPSVKFKALVNVLSEKESSPKIRRLQEKIKSSPRVKLLLSERGKDGRIPYHPYSKWYGAHWVLATLADIGYPPGDKQLIPLREQVYDWLLSKEHEGRAPRTHPYTGPIRRVKDKPRIHASMEGNALYAILRLGLYDVRAERLAERLLRTQWPDGGWNCDSSPKAHTSSFTESLIPLRALALHTEVTGNSRSRLAAERSAEIFLKRKLFRKRCDGGIIKESFVKLHYPCYWHYDILFGLKVMVEAGFIKDRRCREALALLESKRLPEGGFPAEKKYYRVAKDRVSGRSLVDWGPVSPRRMNEYVTADAFYVLKYSGFNRLEESRTM